MKAILIRTGSGSIQAPPLILRSVKASLSDHDPSTGISFLGKNSAPSHRSALQFESKEKTQFPARFRRALSDTELIRSQNTNSSHIRGLNRVSNRSLPARIVEKEDLWKDTAETEGDAEIVLKRKSFNLGMSGVLPGNEVLVEELEFSGGGTGKGRKVGGGNSGGKGGDGSGHGDQSRIGAYYQEMLKANPENPLLLRNYGKFLHEVEKDFERAEEYYGRAILASPGDGEVLSLYGKLIWETQKDQGRANGYFDQAIKACPDDCYVLGSYAYFLWNAEEEEEQETAAMTVSSPLVDAH